MGDALRWIWDAWDRVTGVGIWVLAAYALVTNHRGMRTLVVSVLASFLLCALVVGGLLLLG